MPCQMCHGSLADLPLSARFCSSQCRSTMHNLRRVRGDQIYDLLMQRGSSYKNRRLITEIDRMVRSWLEEDKRKGVTTWTLSKAR